MDKMVSDAGHVWNDIHRDFAVDGRIEFVGANDEVSGFFVNAQVKSTEVGFCGETDTSFRFTCKADHIDYWMRTGRPVVLICVDLRTQTAWWKRVDTWFADPTRRRRRVVDFDKVRDLFDGDAVTRLAALDVPIGQALPRMAFSEQLVSNLLCVDGFAPRLFEASTACRERGDAWERMRANGAFDNGFHLIDGKIYALRDLNEGPLSVLCDGAVTSQPTTAWSDTEDPDLHRRFGALLNHTLRAMKHPDLVWHARKKIVYYQASRDLSVRKVKGSYKRSRGRTFFKPYYGRDVETKLRYCRHEAAGLYFRHWSGRWYLEINPTYHFTIDGRRESLYDAEYVKKIKRMERNNAVYQSVRSWADYLRGPGDTLFGPGDDRIRFGTLLSIEADAAIDEKMWIIQATPTGTADQHLIAGLWEDTP